ncbi:MAG: acyl-CoA carboxylase subunit beta [Epsilonproteobacteria bacterium]|nr:acyl-CoA carboxylase subunit beta [Campylobacterota bacterium]
MRSLLDKLRKLEKIAELGGGKEKIEKQHKAGKLTARERIEILLDPGSFVELDKFVVHQCHNFGMEKTKIYGDGVVTGYGTIKGRQVYIFSHDFTTFGGSLSGAFAKKVCKIMDLAVQNGAPVIGLNDSGGARIQEGVVSLAGYADIFLRNTLASGVVPQISVIMGPTAGGAVYSPAVTDFTIMVQDTSFMFITGPDVIKSVTGEEIDKESLGGAKVHTEKTQVAHFAADNDAEALLKAVELLSFIPQNNMEIPPDLPTSDPADRRDESIYDLIPTDVNKPYEMKNLITKIVDDEVFFEVQENYAKNMVVGFAHFGGKSVGIVADQPKFFAGALDYKAAIKAARFVRFCDAFNIPIITLEDQPGYMPGIDQEHNGVIVHGAKLLYAYAEATVPKITLVVRKAYGGAYDVLGSKHLRADINLAYPTAEIAVMGPDGAVNILKRRELQASKDPDALKAKLVAEYRDQFANPFIAASLGYIDEIIDPADTRLKIISSINLLKNKRQTLPPKKHGNIPL